MRTLHFNKDGRTLFAATRKETVASWLLPTWTVKEHPLEAPVKGLGGREIGAAAFLPHGDKVFFGRHGGALSLYDLAREPAMRTTIQIGDAANGFAFNHIAVNADGTRFCTCHGDSVAYLWEFAGLKKLATLKDFRDQVHAAAFHATNPSLVAGAENVQLFDGIRTSKNLEPNPGGIHVSFTSLQFSPNDRFVAGVRNNTLFRWDPKNLKENPTLADFDERALHVAYSPDGKSLAVAVHFTRIYFYDASTLKQRFMLDLRKDRNNWDTPNAIAFHPEGQYFAVARGGIIYVFDLSKIEEGK